MTSVLAERDPAPLVLSARARIRLVTRSRVAPAALVLLVYGVWLLCMVGSGRDVRDFIHMGRRYLYAPHAAVLFRPDPSYRLSSDIGGYDGQFAFYIAAAPTGARLHLDHANYRYTRIVYPMTARLLSLGRVSIIPYALIAINWLAIAAGTYVVALWLRRRGVSPWLSLAYGLSPGLFVCLQRDLVEPLAYALVALGMYVHAPGTVRTPRPDSGRRVEDDRPPYAGGAGPYLVVQRVLQRARELAANWPEERWRPAVAGSIFALATLTRESMAVVPVVLAIVSWCTAATPRWVRLRAAARLLVPALLPFLLYKAFLLYWFSSNTDAIPSALLPRMVPFSGLTAYYPWRNHQVEVIIGVVAPALVCAAMGVWAVWKRRASPEVWVLLANVLMFVVLLNKLSYENIYATGRIATGVMLAAVWCVPSFDPLTGGDRRWFSFAVLLWLLPWPVLVSFIEEVPLTSALLLELVGALMLWGIVEGGRLAARRLGVRWPAS